MKRNTLRAPAGRRIETISLRSGPGTPNRGAEFFSSPYAKAQRESRANRFARHYTAQQLGGSVPSAPRSQQIDFQDIYLDLDKGRFDHAGLDAMLRSYAPRFTRLGIFLYNPCTEFWYRMPFRFMQCDYSFFI